MFLGESQACGPWENRRLRDLPISIYELAFEVTEYDEIYTSAGSESADILIESADQRRFHRLAGFVSQDIGSSRFLDFGCGRDEFLAAMDDPSGVGFQLGAAGTRTIGRWTIWTGGFVGLVGERLRQGAFDFITAFHLFEHLPDFDRYVSALWRGGAKCHIGLSGLRRRMP